MRGLCLGLGRGPQALEGGGGWLLPKGWGCLKNGARLARPSGLVLCCSGSGRHPGVLAAPCLAIVRSRPPDRWGWVRGGQSLRHLLASGALCHWGRRHLLSRLALVPALRASAWLPSECPEAGAWAWPAPESMSVPILQQERAEQHPSSVAQ